MHEFLHRLLNHTWFPYPFLDATHLDVRRRGRVISQALVVTTGVSGAGEGRDILGMALSDAATTDFWTEFLRGLRVATHTDLLDVTLVTSDAHAGLNVWSHNPIERLNRKFKRRADVQNFPDHDSVTCLISAVLHEQHEQWGYGERRYFSDTSMRKTPPRPLQNHRTTTPRATPQRLNRITPSEGT